MRLLAERPHARSALAAQRAPSDTGILSSLRSSSGCHAEHKKTRLCTVYNSVEKRALVALVMAAAGAEEGYGDVLNRCQGAQGLGASRGAFKVMMEGSMGLKCDAWHDVSWNAMLRFGLFLMGLKLLVRPPRTCIAELQTRLRSLPQPPKRSMALHEDAPPCLKNSTRFPSCPCPFLW